MTFLLTLAYQSFAVIGSGLLIGALTTSNHLLGDAKDKSIKWVLLLSFIFTVVYSLFSQSFGLYSILNIVPYGLVLTALSLDDAIKKRAERTSHRRRNGNQIHTLKVFGIFLSRNYFLPIAVFAFAFAMPIIIFLFNLGNNTERSTVANYIAKIPRKMKLIYDLRFISKIYLESSRKAASQFVLPDLTQLNLVIRKLSQILLSKIQHNISLSNKIHNYLLMLNLHFQKTIKKPL